MIRIKLLVAVLLVGLSVLAMFWWVHHKDQDNRTSDSATVLASQRSIKAYVNPHLHEERYYREIWCAEQGGRTDVVMEDGTCCDCMTEEMVVEVVFAEDAYGGIFQALHCSAMALRPGGLLIIVEELEDWEYVRWANIVIDFYQLPVTVFVIQPPATEP